MRTAHSWLYIVDETVICTNVAAVYYYFVWNNEDGCAGVEPLQDRVVKW